MPLHDQITNWLAALLIGQPPPPDIVAFNVGLYETPDGYCAYLSGATKFDASSDDWALEDAYSPSQREFLLPNDQLQISSWQDALSQVHAALKVALSLSPLSNSALAHAQAVTVGFDDGDLERVA
jgi:hypothetical protein